MIARFGRWLVGPIRRRGERRSDAAMLVAMRALARPATVVTLANMLGWSTYQAAWSLKRLEESGRASATGSGVGIRWQPTGGAR